MSAGTVIVLRDVTEMRHLETIRKDFVANVSHELRTPVSVIRANAETLLGGALEHETKGPQFVQAILRSSERLSTLIADLLDLSRIEAGKYHLEIQSVEVDEAIRHAVEAISSTAQSRRVSHDLSRSAQLHVMADPMALEQVLLNILDNAVKYTKDGGQVQVRAMEHRSGVRFEVEDDGPGIPPQHRMRIFERFYRLDPGRSRELGGTGLGLSIVKHLVESMGGTVGVEPASPHGSVFWFVLPRDPEAQLRLSA
jgi:two-component system phosphate regulon sensor histidine kinase PhoR